jgi:acetyl-CoA C-acetyltransferase
MIDDSTPILVGVGQLTQKGVPPQSALSPMDLMTRATQTALADTGIGSTLAAQIDTIAVVRSISDSTDGTRFKLATYRDPPRSLAKRIGASPKQAFYSAVGGNTPQYLINHFAEKIAQGEVACVLIAAGEALETMVASAKQGIALDWQEDLGTDPTFIGLNKPGNSPHERAHQMHLPTNVYPMFENAIRGKKGRSIADHQLAMGKLFAPFTKVAAHNPHAWFQTERTAEELAFVSERNRMIGFPYPKMLNAMIFVDMAAALIMTSVGQAKAMGISPDKWVFLHGCGDANDIWHVSERIDLHSSPAIRTIAGKAFDMAAKTPAQMDYIDLYSCFPSAVEIGAAEIGIAEDDPRPLTVTGGLPYFGGPGNNYVLHSIATMAEKLRAKPTSFGLVTANGWYITKHSMGIYSTKPVEGPWTREDPARGQAEIDSMPRPVLVEAPSGAAKVESYTVVHLPKGPAIGIVVGRQLSDNSRFLSLVDESSGLVARMEQEEMLDRPGTVTSGPTHNSFTFD